MTDSNKPVLQTRQQGSGPDLVMLHGWGLNSGVYDKMTETLSAYYRVTLIDLPGYGDNNHILPDTYDLPSCASMVAEALPEQCILLGWSFGGLVAQQICLAHPQRIQKLILVASTPRFASVRAEEEDQQWYGIQPEVLDLFMSSLQDTYKKTLDRFMAMQALGSESAKADIGIIKQAVAGYPEPHPLALKAGIDILKQADLRRRMPEIAVPTMRIYGRLDSIVPEKAIPLIESVHPDSRSVLIRKASHAPFISHESEFIAAIREHIEAENPVI